MKPIRGHVFCPCLIQTQRFNYLFECIAKERTTLRRTFGKHRIVVLTREEWKKNRPKQLRKEQVWFTDGAYNQQRNGAEIYNY